jgi:hypothetical protein
VTLTLNAVLDVTLWIGASVNRASGQQAQELKMINHANRAPVSYRDMMDKRGVFFSVGRSFKPGALRNCGYMTELGQDKWVPLFICVEWDSDGVFIGYSQPGVYLRQQRDLETWFDVRVLLDAMFADRVYEHHDNREWFRAEDHDAILKVTRFVQSYLDSVRDADTPEIRQWVAHVLNTGELTLPLTEHGQAA